jgi:large subunit ribosomal protein L23
MDPLSIIRNPLGTEKAIRLMDRENKLIFVVTRSATKQMIKQALEQGYGVKVVKVNTFITHRGEKKAYVKLADENPAIDLATKLGMM